MDAQKMPAAKPHTRNSSPQTGQMGATYAGGIFTAINQPSSSSPLNSFFHQAGESLQLLLKTHHFGLFFLECLGM